MLNWNFWLIFTFFVEHTHPFLENFADLKSDASTRYGRRKNGHFPTFYARIPGRTLFTLLSENLARCEGFGGIFNIFYKKAPDNIAIFRLKTGRSYAQLQPFKLTGCWNLDRLLWPPWRWRHTYRMVCLPYQKLMLKLEFLAHFRIFCRAHTHVSGELFGFEIRCFYKKYGRWKKGHFPAF